MWSHSFLLFFGVTVALLTLSTSETPDCAKDIDKFYACVKTKYDDEIVKLFDEKKKSTFTEEANKCFTSNGCKAPKGNDAATDGADEDEDDGIDINMSYEAVQIKKILNPFWFPGETTKNVTTKQEECANLQDGKAIELITQCVQKTVPGFKFPYDSGLPTKVDYMDHTSEAFGSVEDFFNEAAANYLAALRDLKTCPKDKSEAAQTCLDKVFRAHQMSSFDRTLTTERTFRLLCNVGVECHKATREPCQQWVLKTRTLACDCASSEEDNVVNSLAESYSKCFGASTDKEEIRKTYKNLVKRKCKAMEDDAKQCSTVLQLP
ncbi:hypothetical protein TTRE_0000026501 [Trichuris trichiura]|uniref:Uncharacterized protein n=1 Tax=Trichuris trichiura TaxID=36087 RepID=A0A077YW28_TRITR|nr:hypothetical protein TTRE_0000026501 [Trichuris trichiura]